MNYTFSGDTGSADISIHHPVYMMVLNWHFYFTVTLSLVSLNPLLITIFMNCKVQGPALDCGKSTKMQYSARTSWLPQCCLSSRWVSFSYVVTGNIRVWFPGGFPGGAVLENLPANAGDTGSSPGLGRFPHAAEQLGPWATTTEPARLEPVLRNKRPR